MPIFFLSVTVFADTKKVKVIDGDTIHIGTIKYRFFGIDAPEIKQICEKDYKKEIGRASCRERVLLGV